MSQIFTKKTRGFTLIELLVVIAIIGLLTAIIVVAVAGYRNKAKDARIIEDMTQIRTIAEMVRDNDGNYDNVCIGAPPCNADINTLATDIDNLNPGGATDLTIYKPASPAMAYCAEIEMNTGWYCIDWELRGGQYPNPPDCAAGVYTCE